jgi:hypothetical protein
MIGTPLHLTVQPHGWWAELFLSLGYVVAWQEERDIASLFIVRNI